jgi:hypothetical protein
MPLITSLLEEFRQIGPVMAGDADDQSNRYHGIPGSVLLELAPDLLTAGRKK